MNRSHLIRVLTRLQRCPKCRHINYVQRCTCTDHRCVCFAERPGSAQPKA